MQQFIADESFWKLFPNARLGVVVATGLKLPSEVSEEDKKAIHNLLIHANLAADKWLEDPQLSKNKVIAVWREAYQKFKTKKGARVSIENLLKRASKGNPVGDIAPLVDIYNALSLRYALPFGAEDVDSFVGNLVLKITDGGDEFDPLGEGSDPTLAGELAYIDNAGAVCRCFNWRDGQRTAITNTTRNVFIVTECIDPERTEEMAEALATMAALIEKHLGGTILTQTCISSDNRSCIIAE
ncbi:B3/B4 domain-containing protein [Atopobium fossor]|uniref:B3/B4 domain-containing protein n=1 Tax=Atopobium fossor TaxID=39487 RepID=UPI000427C6B4|nr:phenylalanine--tRNA ligase beta subunit-related protein [Atopobium fossor]